MTVDDEPAVLNLLKEMLEIRGYDVMAVNDGRDALKLLEVAKVDGLFVDASMPRMDGFKLTRLVRTLKLNGQVPIVMLTGSDDGETMRRGFDAGISFFLGKPLNRERVYHLLRAANGLMTREQLRYVRVPFRTTVGCSWGDHGTGHFKSDSQDISEGGMHLSPLGGLPVGQGVHLVFALPGNSQKLSADAQVARKGPLDETGVKFINLLPQELEAIRQYISASVKD